MPEKRVLPLNNPLSEKTNNTNAGKTHNKPVVVDIKGREKGVSKGGRERVRPAEALIKCQMCGRVQKVVFPVGKPPEYHKCIWCNQVQPTDGYRVIMYGLDLPRVLTPHELAARQREIETMKGAQ